MSREARRDADGAPRQLVLCIDGTGNKKHVCAGEASHASNVAHVSDLLLNDGEQQIVQYFSGVGTEGPVDRLIGGAYGTGITEKVRNGYRWLCERYRSGDRLALFGFSRGAFAVRLIIGVIVHIGMLKIDHLDRIDEGIVRYRTAHRTRLHRQRDYQSKYSHGLPHINFIGVWDTVPRYGPFLWPIRLLLERLLKHKFNLHDSRRPSFVSSAYHALALDEARAAFLPHRWQRGDGDLAQRVEEVWFCGDHADVGGGDREENQACQIPLAWMVKKAMLAGLRFQAIPEVSEGAHSAVLHDESRRHGWRLLSRALRTLRDDDTLHESVFRRMRETSYAPQAHSHLPNETRRQDD